MKDGQAPDAAEQERLQEFLRWRQASSRRRPARGRGVLFFCVGATAGILTGLLIMMVVRAVLDGPARLASGSIQKSAEDLDHTLRRVLPSVEPTRPGMEATELVPAEEMDSVARLRSAEAPPPAIAPEERRTATSGRRGVRMERRTRPAREPVATIADRSRPIPAPLDPATARRDTIDRAEAGAAASTNATSAMPATLAADLPRDVAADSPPSAPVTASLDPGSEASGARGQRSRTMETMTRLIGYIPEVRVGRAIVRWTRSQPPVDRQTPPSRDEAPQAR